MVPCVYVPWPPGLTCPMGLPCLWWNFYSQLPQRGAGNIAQAAAAKRGRLRLKTLLYAKGKYRLENSHHGNFL